jgi:hypothetical protein
MLAVLRPDNMHWPLFLHVLAATVMVGGLATALSAQFLAWRANEPERLLVYTRGSFRALLFVTLPAWLGMHAAAEWLVSTGWDKVDPEPAWISIGYITADLGGLLLVISIVLTGIASRRLRANRESTTLVRVAAVLSTLILVAWVVAIWAMSVKPS